MADLTRYFDNQWTLEQTKHACEFEQAAGYQLQTITSGTTVANNEVLLVNKADFMSQPIGAERELLFVEVGTQDPELLKSQKKGEGWSFISYSRIYVAGELVWVMVFAKK